MIPSFLSAGRGRSSAAWLLGVAACLAATSTRGELIVVKNADDQIGSTVYKLTVTPAPEPTPAFRYRLSPGALQMRPGNAALYYLRAFTENGVAGAWKGITKEHGAEEVDGGSDSSAWYSIERPLSEMPLDKARQAAARFDAIVQQYVARAVVREDCDWGRNLEELRGLDVIGLLLPEIQDTRSLARALLLRVRVAVADRDFDRAVDELTMIYRMGRHVASDPILVCGLVGLAEANLATTEIIEFIAAQDAPNMYWALAELERPLVDLRPAVQHELRWGFRIFPILHEPEKNEHSPEEWARQLAKAFTDVQAATTGGPNLKQPMTQLAVTGLSLIAYSDAKERLTASGMDRDAVERMPVGQVIAIDASREFRRLADEFEKGWYVPRDKAGHYFAVADDDLGRSKFEGGYGRILASVLLPAFANLQGTQLRSERLLNAVQTIEAVRLHAAASGKLPTALADVSAVPVPRNPATGQPFQYRLEGETAVLELPAGEVAGNEQIRFEITLAK
ncbi:MAG: hypothetical protein IT424_16040 [Pirellulales bacterium]|nr:hypothetical protein [Pirellulales bacterium]